MRKNVKIDVVAGTLIQEWSTVVPGFCHMSCEAHRTFENAPDNWYYRSQNEVCLVMRAKIRVHSAPVRNVYQNPSYGKKKGTPYKNQGKSTSSVFRAFLSIFSLFFQKVCQSNIALGNFLKNKKSDPQNSSKNYLKSDRGKSGKK